MKLRLKNCIEPFTLTNMGDLVWIMDNAFENSGISGTLTLPESLEYIGIQAFADCRNLEAVWFPGSAFDPDRVLRLCRLYLTGFR